jgi:hypothetical protein
MPGVTWESVILLFGILTSVILPIVIMLFVILQSVILLSGIVQNVVKQLRHLSKLLTIWKKKS